MGLKRLWFRGVIYWLEFIHWAEWRWWEHKWVRIVNGQKNYSRWPQCQKSTPEWKHRVRRVQRINILWKRIAL